MRGRLSNQDLTNYALNDGLDGQERLYVESMLAVSEECRHDVYAMMEISQLIETGFDRERSGAVVGLTPEQRQKLLQSPSRAPAVVFFQQVSSALALAACAAFMLVHPQFWPAGASARKMARVSSKMNQMAGNTGTRTISATVDDFAQFVDLHDLVDDSAAWLQQASEALPQSGTICTPPSWPDGADFAKPR